MEEYMKKRYGVASVLAAAALVASAVVGAPANAAGRTIVVWADEQRGPQLQKLIDGNTTIAPGYTIQVKFFSALDALQSAWDKSSAAGGPDVLTGPASMAAAGGKSGKLARILLDSATRRDTPSSAIAAMSYKGNVYGVALDVDTTAFLWNKSLFGSTAPATFGDMVDYYKTNKSAKGLTGGICAFEGTWGSQAVLTALGGGAWGYKGSNAQFDNVLLNSSTFKSNVSKYLLDGSKSNGFFQWDGCGDAFKAGKIPFAITGAWNFDGITKAGVSYGIGATPGLTKGTYGAQWVNYSGAYVTSYAKTHGVDLGARKLVVDWFASKTGQLAMSNLSKRPPASLSATAAVTDAQTLAVGRAAATGTPQVSPALDDKTGGSNWYDVLGSVYTDVFTKGKDLDSTLNAAAAILKKNFAAYAASL
jgi:arabinogalactan oligomer/maltooligosaccharide transport system substrate-binding protein